jgi:hypothetical protein
LLVHSDFNFTDLEDTSFIYLFSDNKEYDVFVCYDQTDTEFALGVLVHTLEKVYHYRCFVYERDSVAGDCKYKSIKQFYKYVCYSKDAEIKKIL